MLSALIFASISTKHKIKNVFYVSDTNFTEVMTQLPAAILFIQQGSNERYRFFSDFINAAPELMTRCYFVVMNGDRSTIYRDKHHLTHTKGYYFYRYGKFIEQYTGETDSESITKYALEKTGLAFTTFQDYPSAEDFIEVHKTTVVLFLKHAKGKNFEQFKEIAEKYRDSYAFGFCPDADITYELRVRDVPSIVLFRNADKGKIVFPENITEEIDEKKLILWIKHNEQPYYDVFDLNNQKIYDNKTVGLFFVPVEQEDKDKSMYQINQITIKYKGKLLFAIIDAATGNRFMQSLGFSRYADPCFVILEYNDEKITKHLYPEGSPFRSKDISHFIDEFFSSSKEL